MPAVSDVPLATATVALANVFRDDDASWLPLVLPACLVTPHSECVSTNCSPLAASRVSCASLLVRATTTGTPIPTENLLSSALQPCKNAAISNARDHKEMLLPWEGVLCLPSGSDSDAADDDTILAAAASARRVGGFDEYIVLGYDPLIEPWMDEMSKMEIHGAERSESSLANRTDCGDVAPVTEKRLLPLRSSADATAPPTPTSWRDLPPVSGLNSGISGPGLLFVSLQPPAIARAGEHQYVLEGLHLNPLSTKRSPHRSVERQWAELGRCCYLPQETNNLSPEEGLQPAREAFVAGVDWSLKRPVVPLLRLRALHDVRASAHGQSRHHSESGFDGDVSGVISLPVDIVGSLSWPGHLMHLSVQFLGCDVEITLCFLPRAALPAIWQRKCYDLLRTGGCDRGKSEDHVTSTTWEVPQLPSRIQRPVSHQSTAICLRIAHISVLRPPTIPPNHRLRLDVNFCTSSGIDAAQLFREEKSERCSMTLEPSSNTSALWVCGNYLKAAPVLQVARVSGNLTPMLHLTLWFEPTSDLEAHEEEVSKRHATFALPAEEEQASPVKATLLGRAKLPLPENLLSGGRPFDSWLPLTSANQQASCKIAECRIALHAWSSRAINPPVKQKEVVSTVPGGYLRVLVVGGRNLRPVGRLGHSDPFVALSLFPHGQNQPVNEKSSVDIDKNIAVRTPVATNGGDCSPFWGTVIYLPIPPVAHQSASDRSGAHHVIKARMLSACIASSDPYMETSSGGGAVMGEVHIQVPWFVLPRDFQPQPLSNGTDGRCFRGWHVLNNPRRPHDFGCGELELEIDFVAALEHTEERGMEEITLPPTAPSSMLLGASPHSKLLGVALNPGASTSTTASSASTNLALNNGGAELTLSKANHDAGASPLKVLSEKDAALLDSREFVEEVENPKLAPTLRLRDSGPQISNASSNEGQGVCLLEWRPNAGTFTGTAVVKADVQGHPGAPLATVGAAASHLVLRVACSSLLNSALWFEFPTSSSSSSSTLGRLGLDATRAMPGSRLNSTIESLPHVKGKGNDYLGGQASGTISPFDGSSCVLAWLPLTMKGTLKLKLLSLKPNAGCLSTHSLLGAKGNRKLRLRARTAVGGALAFSERTHPLTRKIADAALDFNGDEIGLFIDAAKEFQTCELSHDKFTLASRGVPDQGANQGICPQAVVEIAALDQTTGAFENWLGSGDLALAPLLAAAARAASRGLSCPSRPAVLQVPLRPRRSKSGPTSAAPSGESSTDDDVSAWITLAATFEPTNDCLQEFWGKARARPSTTEAKSVVKSLAATTGVSINDQAEDLQDLRAKTLSEADWRLRSAFFVVSLHNAASNKPLEDVSSSTVHRGSVPQLEPHVLVSALEAHLLELFPPLPTRVDFTSTTSTSNEALLNWRQHISALFGLAITPSASLAAQQAAWSTGAAVAAMLPSMLCTLRSMARKVLQAETCDDGCATPFSDYDAVLNAAFTNLASASLVDATNLFRDGASSSSSSPSSVVHFPPSTLARFAARLRADLATSLWSPPSEIPVPTADAKARDMVAADVRTDVLGPQSSERAGLVAELRGLRRRLKSLDSAKSSSTKDLRHRTLPSRLSRALEMEPLKSYKESNDEAEALILNQEAVEEEEVSQSLVVAHPPNSTLALITQPVRKQALVASDHPDVKTPSSDRWSDEQAELETEVAHLQQQCMKVEGDRRKAAMVADLALTRSGDIQARLEHASDAALVATREREALESELQRAQRQLSITSTAHARKKAREEAVVLFLRPEIEAMSAKSKAREAASSHRKACATALQSSTRRWLVNRRTEKEAQAAHVLGSALRRLLRRAKQHLAIERRDAAAIKLQTVCRGRRVRRQLPLLLHVLPKLQARFRANRLREGRSTEVLGTSSMSARRGCAGLSPLALKRKEKTDQAAAARDRAERLVRIGKRNQTRDLSGEHSVLECIYEAFE